MTEDNKFQPISTNQIYSDGKCITEDELYVIESMYTMSHH